MAAGNSTTLVGNLCGDPQHKTFDGGNELASFQIAWNENRKNQQTGQWETIAHFFEVECWAGVAKMAMKFRKGDLATVTGRLRWRSWTNRENVQQERVSIVADAIMGEPMFLPAGTIGAQLPPKQRRPNGPDPYFPQGPPPEPREVPPGVPLADAMAQAMDRTGPSPMPVDPVPGASGEADDGIPW
jgi:single stranded DNA-binding protein